MFGLPMEGEKEQLLAADFYNRTRPDSISCFWLTYYLGTRMLEIAKEKGWITEDEFESIKEGKATDYGNHRHSDIIRGKDKEKSLMYKNFLILFKLLPLLPPRAIKYIIAKKLYRFFNLAPYSFIDFLKIVNMFKKRDHLIFAHYRYYFYQTIRRYLFLSKLGHKD